jgi:hypothetical protein
VRAGYLFAGLLQFEAELVARLFSSKRSHVHLTVGGRERFPVVLGAAGIRRERPLPGKPDDPLAWSGMALEGRLEPIDRVRARERPESVLPADRWTVTRRSGFR